jgi:outer membrane protein TolC
VLLLAAFGFQLARQGGAQLSSGQTLGLLEAVSMTLEHDPNLGVVQARLESSRGALLSAAGKFDPVVTNQLLDSDTKAPLGTDRSFEQTMVENDLGVSKLFRGGLSITPAVSLVRLRDTSVGPDTGNTAAVSFAFRQPLLRGRGRAATDAVELAAGREVAASGLDLLHTTAERVQAVAAQYWSFAAAQAGLAVLRDSEASSRVLLETTRKLIEADVTPAAELVQLEANVVSKEAARIGGELAVFQARQELGRQIGLDAAEIGALPPAGDPFPAGAAAVLPAPAEAPRLIATALAHRADLQAARTRLESADIQVRAADNALEAQLDLVLTPRYNGLTVGVGAGAFFGPLGQNVPGASFSVGLDLSWPTANRVARGQLEQALAGRRQSALAVDLLVKGIGADVPAALEAVVRDAAQLERATLAVRLFERAVDNEEKKLKGGTSTLIDVITQRDRLTAAREAEVQSRLALALALLDLRFQTGTLVTGTGEAARLSFSDLTTVPAPSEPGGAP